MDETPVNYFLGCLVKQLEEIKRLPLVINICPPSIGVYLLYKNDNLVYVGKTTHLNLRNRCNDHVRRVAGRRGLSSSDITCKYLILQTPPVITMAEHHLIDYFQPKWNGSGFGTRTQRECDSVSLFDSWYPKEESETPSLNWCLT